MAGPGQAAAPTVSVPAPNYAALISQNQNPWNGVLQGFQNFLAQRQQAQQFQMLQKQAQQTLVEDQARTQLTQTQATAAKQTLNERMFQNIGQQFLSNPQLAQDPNARQNLTSAAMGAGRPAPFLPDGSFDKSAFQQPFSGITNQDFIEGSSLPVGPLRDAYWDRFSGVPQEMYTAPVNYEAKILAQFQKNSIMGVHYHDMNATAQGRLAVAQATERLKDPNLNPILRNQMLAKTQEYRANATRATQEGSRAVAQTRIYSQEAAANIGTLRAAYEAYRSNPVTGASGLMRVYQSQVTALNRAHAAYAQAQGAYEAATANTADDSTITPLRDKMIGALQQYQQVRQQVDALRTQINAVGDSNTTLQRGMGAKGVTVHGSRVQLAPLPDALTSGPSQGTTEAIDVNNLPHGAIHGTDNLGHDVYYSNGNVYDQYGTLTGPAQ